MSNQNRSSRGRITFFLILGLVPILVVGAVAWQVTGRIKGQVAERLSGSAMSLAAQVERELGRCHDDIQAASTDSVILDRSAWYRSWETNSLVRSLNSWVSGHSECLLAVLVDPKGDLIAVNSLDAGGDSIPSDLLYLINHGSTDWFKAIEHSTFLATMDDTRRISATPRALIQDVTTDQEVRHCYPDDTGRVITLIAPVIEDGQVIAYLNHRIDFNLIENLFPLAQLNLQKDFPGLQITLLDGENLPLTGADDTSTESTADDQSLSLRQEGLTTLTAASRGIAGFTWDFCDDSSGVQAAGLAPLAGSDDLPAMGWNICLSVSQAELVKRSGLARVRSQLRWTLAALIPILAGLLMVFWRELDRKPRPHRESLLATQSKEHLLGQLDLGEKVAASPDLNRLKQMRRGKKRKNPAGDESSSTGEVKGQLEELSREMLRLGIVEQELEELQRQNASIKRETDLLRQDRALALQELEKLRDETMAIWQKIATGDGRDSRTSGAGSSVAEAPPVHRLEIGDAAMHEMAHDLAACTGEPVVITEVGRPGEIIVEPVRLQTRMTARSEEPVETIPPIPEPEKKPKVMAARANQSSALMDFGKNGDMASRRIGSPA